MIVQLFSLFHVFCAVGSKAQIFLPRNDSVWEVFNVTTGVSTEPPGYLGLSMSLPEAEITNMDSTTTISVGEKNRTENCRRGFNEKHGEFSRAMTSEVFVLNPCDLENNARQVFVVDSWAEQFHVKPAMVDTLRLLAVGECTTFVAHGSSFVSPMYAVQLQFVLHSPGGSTARTDAMNVTACSSPRINKNILSKHICGVFDVCHCGSKLVFNKGVL